MGTLLYSPAVKVYIDTEKKGTIEVTDDLVDGTMVRRSDGVSSFNFTLQNARRKYDGVFAPNDRIVVMMRRISWMRVFTGYLNSVPLLTAWPRVVPLAASCSLKRLQYWYWDAGLPASQQMVAKALQAVKTADDGGMANVVLTIMKEVVGWPPEKIHIAGIPDDWFDFAHRIAKDIDARAEEADQIAQQFYSALQGQGTVGGTGVGGVANGTLKPGNYGGENLNATMCKYAEMIYNHGAQMGGSSRDRAIGIMTAMAESTLGANVKAMTTPNQYGCIGLFQQTIKGFRPGWGPNEGWGTKAQLLDPNFQCKNFFSRLLKLKGRDRMSMAQAAEKIQVSGGTSWFAKRERMALAVTKVLDNAGQRASGGGGAPSQGNDPNWRAGAGSRGSGKATGQQLVDTGVKLVTQNKNIRYQLGGDDPPNTPMMKVRKLDCSSFIQWVVYNTLGSLHGLPRVTWSQISYLKAHGKKITAEQGATTAGAILFTGSGGHVEMSIGDGRRVVGAHSTRSGVNVKDFGSKRALTSYLTQAYLLPNVQYSIGSGGTYTPGGEGDPGVGGAPQIPIERVQDQPWYNANDEYDKLFGNNPWVPKVNQDEQVYSSLFTGIRALLNDQPLLPYLKNLFNSTMRSFSSAPNGDLIAWFPDYYGIWGTAAAMIVEPIEIKDFNVEWSDDFFVTHQYATASASTNFLDLATGLSAPASVLNAAMTVGIATIDVPSILYALFGIEADKDSAVEFINYIYKRFGARPDFQQLPGVVGSKGQFFSALFLFMRQWAYQYNADIPLTFMPELWPGMLIKIPKFDFQAYVTTVTHNFSFGENGGFSTSVNIAAPARLPKSVNDRNHALVGLPIAGGLNPTPNPKKKN